MESYKLTKPEIPYEHVGSDFLGIQFDAKTQKWNLENNQLNFLLTLFTGVIDVY